MGRQHEQQMFNLDRAVQQHGEFVFLENGLMVFEDGACRSSMPLCHLELPDNDLYERHKMIVKYHQRRFDLAVAEFTAEKNNQLQAAHHYQKSGYAPSDTQPQIDKLKALKIKVAKRKIRLQNAQEELQKNTPDHIKNRPIKIAQNRQKAQGYLAQIKAVQI